jgi:hypothetical protein
VSHPLSASLSQTRSKTQSITSPGCGVRGTLVAACTRLAKLMQLPRPLQSFGHRRPFRPGRCCPVFGLSAARVMFQNFGIHCPRAPAAACDLPLQPLLSLECDHPRPGCRCCQWCFRNSSSTVEKKVIRQKFQNKLIKKQVRFHKSENLRTVFLSQFCII